MGLQYAAVMNLEEIDESEFTETELGILRMLQEGRCTPAYIAEELDVSQEYVRGRLGELKRLGLVHDLHRGLYELDEDE